MSNSSGGPTQGDYTITINGWRKETVKAGSSLLFALWGRKIFIPSVCGGQGKCGYCKVQVVKGGGDRLPSEEALLTPEEKVQGLRLACQVRVTEDIEISVPEDFLAARMS